MKWTPFTIHMKILPYKSGKRLEMWRDMQKISEDVYGAMSTLSPSTINIALPGGGQHRSYGGFSSSVGGMAVKPQFGETPAQLQLTGFYNSSAQNVQPHTTYQIIQAGSVYEGSKSHTYEDVPVTTVNDEVKDLKTQIETALSTNVAANVKVFRIDYCGIIYGDSGYHFPQ